MTLLTIPRPLYQQILAHCREEWPREAVGVLLGCQGRVELAVALRNVHADPERYFALDPVDQEEALRPVTQGRYEYLALYHSHPNSVAVPSVWDRRAHRGAAFQLIISMTQEPPDVRAYRMDKGEPQPVPHRKGDDLPWEWVDLRQ